MEKQKRWQFYLILGVILLTVYNILPTLFYYSKPLKKPVTEAQATDVASSIIERVNSLEEFTLDWLATQSKNLHLKPLSIALDKENPRLAHIEFKKPEEAKFFAQTLRRAGALIPFAPAELNPDPRSFKEETTVVTVQRKIGIHLDPAKQKSYFQYIPKLNKEGEITKEYRTLIQEKALPIVLGFGGMSDEAKNVQEIASSNTPEDLLLRLSRNIVEFENAFGESSPITKRYYATFSQTASAKKAENIDAFATKLQNLSSKMGEKLSSLKAEDQKRRAEGQFSDVTFTQKLETLQSQKNIIDKAYSIVDKNKAQFKQGLSPLSSEALSNLTSNKVDTLSLGERNPFVESVTIDWNKETIDLFLHPDVVALKEAPSKTEAEAMSLEKLNQLLFNEIASVARKTDETITPSLSHFTISLNELTNSTSLLALNLPSIANEQMHTLMSLLNTSWKPSKELSPENFPLYEKQAFDKLPKDQQKLGLVFYAPVMDKEPVAGFKSGSIYVIGRGIGHLLEKYENTPSEEKKAFDNDFRELYDILRQNGFIGYRGEGSGLPQEFKNDYIFELNDYASYLIAATRENFSLKGIKKQALLEFTNYEQRILTLNKIETSEQEDLVKWKDEYSAAQVNPNPQVRFEVPPPVKSPFLNNMKLSFLKYFRGDERKVIKWGLDLSGGKTVRIGLKDQNGRPISNVDDINQAINELYTRVNKLGVSEIGIRSEGSTIVLDFPGSQGFSASELVKASAMYFHVVNEKFTPLNSTLGEAVNTFLEEVWNEAVITNRKDPDSVNLIAWQHLGGNPDHPEEFQPLTQHAKLLYENGLRLGGPKSPSRSSAFDETLSSVAIMKGTDFSEWQGQTNPLLIVFRNFALEGSSLTDVLIGYDPSEGNTLSFAVKGSSTRSGEKINPREDFYNWTSQFAEDKIAGTPKEAFSQGRGWRMAVILNGAIVSAPTLNAALKDSARITGHFTQREINQLAADLKAGSLSFTPYILSEENVSPDLGKEQRNQGIMAAALGLILVIATMCIYYRFGGLVASVAVLFNLLIIWAVLQNLGAALTLSSIAGIILAVGMSVDANVLVFERIREEFAISGRLPSAIQAGYKKAFSAIIDSNLTTIIAAVILLNFDSGPIKGFALTLIIGIVSSMFTSLFMTRYFFAGWVQNPKHKELKMLKFFNTTHFNFLKKAKVAIVTSLILIVVGLGIFAYERNTILGMDFTGGYALTLNLQDKENVDYRKEAAKALIAKGAGSSDFQIRELNRPTQLRIQLSQGMENPGKPFYRIDEKAAAENPLFAYQEYPRIVWIVQALEEGGLKISPAALPELNLHWTEMSGQLSDTMRNQAIIGLVLALICILIYITFRFEFKYAISATIGLAHDILITLGFLAVLHLIFPEIQIDLQVIAALMTIIGYSLNDTIIIFDRIREDLRLMRKMSFTDVVNHALNATLSRTVMTSGTTLVALLALVLFGGSSIFNFSLIMAIGVAVGTLSSLFVAAPLLVFFHKKEVAKEENPTTYKTT